MAQTQEQRKLRMRRADAVRRAKPQNRVYQHAYRLQKNFGLTVGEYDRMFLEQEGRCYICGNPERAVQNGRIKKLAVDHNHRTGKVRHLLCSSCNCMIGYARENPLTLEKAAAYLRVENAH